MHRDPRKPGGWGKERDSCHLGQGLLSPNTTPRAVSSASSLCIRGEMLIFPELLQDLDIKRRSIGQAMEKGRSP